MWSSTDTEILKMLVCTYEPHTTKVGWWHWYTMKEFKIKIKTQKQFLVQMNLTYYSLKLQLLTEYTHTHTHTHSPIYMMLSAPLHIHFPLCSYYFLSPGLSSPSLNSGQTSFLILLSTQTWNLLQHTPISPFSEYPFKGQPLCIILLQTVL